jgi:hypothetical protein
MQFTGKGLIVLSFKGGGDLKFVIIRSVPGVVLKLVGVK